MSEDKATAPTNLWRRAGLLLSIVLLGFLLRIAHFDEVFRPEGVVFTGRDAYYHMHRIAHGVEHFPDFLEFDPWMHFPEGAAAIWPPWFDGSIATGLRLFGVDDRATAQRIAAFVPPLLGAVAIGLVGMGASLVAGAGLLAALILSLLGGHLIPTELGFLDHHAAMGVWVGLFLLVGNAAARSCSRGWSALFGVVIAGSILTWPGCLVLLAIAELWLISLLLGVSHDPSRFRRVAWNFGAWFHGTAASLLILGCARSPWAQEGQWTLTTLSWMQPSLAWMATVWCVLAGTWGGRQRRTPLINAMALLGSGLVLVLGLFALEGVRSSAADALQWVSKDESFQSMVGESRPLFSSREVHASGASAWIGAAIARLGWFALLLPGVFGFSVWRVRRRGFRREGLMFWSVVVLGGLTLLQRRFTDAFSIPWAIALAAACWSAFESVRSRLFRNAPPRLLRVIGFLLLLAGLWPSLSLPWARAGNALRVAGGSPPIYSLRTAQQWEIYRVARWIQEWTPSPLGDDGTLQYSVLCFWDLGHVIQSVGRRPVVVNNFGDDLGDRHFEDSMEFLLVKDESRALEILEKYRVRYVVTRSPRSEGELVPGSVVHRLHANDGNVWSSPGGERWPRLQHFRLVHESGPDPGRGRKDPWPLYKVFEFVPGALVEGQANPGSQVNARLRLKSNQGRPFQYIAAARTGPDGRFQLRIPYSTEPSEGLPQILGGLRLVSGDASRSRKIPERAVLRGETLEGNDFPGEPPK